MCLAQTKAYEGFGLMLCSRASSSPGTPLCCVEAIAALITRDAKPRRRFWGNWDLRDLARSLAGTQSLGQGLGPLTARHKAEQGNCSSSGRAAFPQAWLEQACWGSSYKPDLNKLFNVSSAAGAEKKPPR